MNTGLGTDSNQTTPDDITLIAIGDGYLDGYWALVDSNLDLHVTSKQNGPWTVTSSNLPTTVDTNYGTVGANTLRSAAQIGNATGAADFNVGTTTGQTLRVASNLSDGYGTKLSSTIVSGKDGLDVYLLNPTLAVTQSTSPWVVSGTVVVSNLPTTLDTNYGTVGANTLRTASQIGNATGQADFNVGVTGAQTLRVTSNLSDGYGTKLSSTIVGGKDGLDVNIINSSIAVTGTVATSNFPTTVDTNYGTVGANTLRSAAQIGNSTGQADFNRGATGAQTLRVAGNNYDGYGNAISSTVVSGKNGLDVNIIDPITATLSADFNYGTVGASTLRTASQIGNATGAADFNFGTVGAQTLRTAAEVGNASGLADFNRGTTGAQTLRVTSNLNDGYGIQLQSVGGALNVNLTNTPTVTVSNFPTTLDTNYGTVGASTLRTASEIGNATGAANFNYGTVGAQTVRTAAQIGNATGAADFNVGVTGAQTLRVTSNMSDGYGIQLASTLGSLNVYLTDDRNYGTVGANTLRTASQIGNATGAADFNFGTVGAQTLRTASQLGNATGAADFNRGATGAQTLRVAGNNYDGYGNAISSTVVSGKSGLDVNVINTTPVTLTYDTNYGTVGANTLRGAAQIGNATGAADFNVGTSGAQTLRTASNLADGYANRITSAAHPNESRRGLDMWPMKGTVQHFNGTTANTSAITITPASAAISILIYNPGTNAAGSTVSASFDGGTNFFTIPLGSNLSVESEIVTSFLIKGSAAGIVYQILVTHG